MHEVDLKPLIHQLHRISGGNLEGNLLFDTSVEVFNSQTAFLEKYFFALQPKKILEIGTNKGMFSIFCKRTLRNNFEIFTFGIDEWSDNCIKRIEKYFKQKFVNFYHGNSFYTLSNFHETEIDIAWVDGDHSYKVALSDLENCQRLKIKNIFVDDYLGHAEVKLAVDDFCKKTSYNIIDSTSDERGIVLLSSF